MSAVRQALYHNMFNHLVLLLNKHLIYGKDFPHDSKFIGVLDIYGITRLTPNPTSFLLPDTELLPTDPQALSIFHSHSPVTLALTRTLIQPSPPENRPPAFSRAFVFDLNLDSDL
jgi:hypothetical protein